MEKAGHCLNHVWAICFSVMLASGVFAPVHAGNAPAHSVAPETGGISPALATSVPAAMAAVKKKAVHLIDVRQKTDFDQFHIPGALNISLHAVRTKAYLKNKPVVLVNEGFALKEMADACRTLNASGFKATILAGGLVSWKAKGGRIEGDPFAMTHLNRISPMQYLKEAGSGHHLLVEATTAPVQKTDPLFKGAQDMDLLGNKKHVARIKKTLRKKTADPFRTLVVYSENGEQDEHIQRRLVQEGLSEFFIVQGGRKACEKQRGYLNLAHRPRKERTKSSNGCTKCAAQ